MPIAPAHIQNSKENSNAKQFSPIVAIEDASIANKIQKKIAIHNPRHSMPNARNSRRTKFKRK